MSKILANQIANYADNSPIELKEGLNIPAGKELQAGGTFGTLGQVLSSDGTTIEWKTPFSGNYQDLTNKPTIPAPQLQSDWTATSGVQAILNKPTIPPTSSATVASASGGGNLSYNGGNGEFTYTPPDLSGYLTSLGDAAGVTTAKITNWDTAHGWGNHASAGYITSIPAIALGGLSNVSSNAPSTGQVLKWDGSEWAPGTDLTASGGSGITLTDLSTSTAAASGGGALSYNNGTGVFTFTPADVSSFITSEADTLATVTGRGATTTTAVTFDADVTFNGASYNLQWDKSQNSLEFGDEVEAKFGLNGDLKISHTMGLSGQNDSTGASVLNGNDWCSLISEAGTGGLVFKSNGGHGSKDFQFFDSSWRPIIRLFGGATSRAVLYHAGVQALESTATGITIAGSLTASGGNSSNWNTAYGWGNHASGGYLTSFTETDPVYGASAAANVTNTKIGNWDTAFGWGNHASASYITDVVSDTTPQLGGNLDVNGKIIENPVFRDPNWTQDGTEQVSIGSGSLPGIKLTDGGKDCDIFNSGAGSLTIISDSSLSSNVGINTYAFFWGSSGGTSGNVQLNNGDVGHTKVGNNITFTAAGGAIVSTTYNGLAYPTVNGSANQVLSSDGAGNVVWGASSGYSLPTASATVLGGIKVGTNLDIDAGTSLLSLSNAISLGSIAQYGAASGGGSSNSVTMSSGGNWWDDGLVLQATAGGFTPLKFLGTSLADGVAFRMRPAGVSGTQTFYVPTSDGGAGHVLTTDGSGNLTFQAPSSGGARQTYTATTASIADGASGDITIVAYKTYALLDIETSAAAWVTLYTDTTARTADALRSETTDPTPGSGVIAEVITTGNQSQMITPGVVGFNADNPTPSTNVYLKVVNKSGGPASITVGITVVAIEG